MIKTLPDQSLLLNHLTYDPETGRLFRRALSSGHFATTGDARGADWACHAFNSRFAGKEAFTASDPRGYRHGKVQGVKYQAHRIIWKIVYGVDPDQIDHINGDPSDNRLINLRSCSSAENSRNYAKPAGTSRYRGVCWIKRDQIWAARISNGAAGKISLGNFKNETDAARAYDAAARRMHGEFATLNFPGEAQ